ncbi:hypothetical protein DQ04_00011050 [Trypanosoma grayi]|uniref:hypothetical protein n=1 Tax=Trypanosoma grayi TaxID=71804 RepID=UPI0004F4B53F|nr:hypothetical protein DQ04_00011050 [Trypanosoma grayi]KEG15638.1 hypothetical protein DQ04_00011050 [Trypanosoma grayi]
MDYSTAQYLRRLGALSASADAIEDRMQMLLTVVGRRDAGWREADAELKALRRQLLSRCCREVWELAQHKQREEKGVGRKDISHTPVWSTGGGSRDDNIGVKNKNSGSRRSSDSDMNTRRSCSLSSAVSLRNSHLPCAHRSGVANATTGSRTIRRIVPLNHMVSRGTQTD